jgi:hypothetical protein
MVNSVNVHGLDNTHAFPDMTYITWFKLTTIQQLVRSYFDFIT